ncbi:MAG: hypothetical protein U0235_07610 [Polyangiaceae bacterium]
MRPSFLFIALLPVLSTVACSGGGGGTLGGGDGGASPSSSSGNGTSSNGASGSSAPAGATSVTCKVADDCGNWFCDCSSGPPVNSRSCTNGYCLDAAHTCPKACQDFGVTWAGTAGGGPTKRSTNSGSSTSDPSPRDSQVCAANADCPELDCSCTDGFTKQSYTVQKCAASTKTCVTAKADACPGACGAFGLSWLGN